MAKAIDYKIPEGSKLLFEVKHLFRGVMTPTGWAVYQNQEGKTFYRTIIPGKVIVDYYYNEGGAIIREQVEGTSSFFRTIEVFRPGSWKHGVLDYQMQKLAKGEYINALEANKQYGVQLAKERREWKLGGAKQ